MSPRNGVLSRNLTPQKFANSHSAGVVSPARGGCPKTSEDDGVFRWMVVLSTVSITRSG